MRIGSWHGIPESAKPTYNRYHVLWGNGDFKTYEFGKDLNKSEYAANRTRTCDMLVNSQPLYQLSYGGTRISAL